MIQFTYMYVLIGIIHMMYGIIVDKVNFDIFN